MGICLVAKEKIFELPEFDEHALVYHLDEPENGLFGYIAIHRAYGTIPSFGATRVWGYGSEQEALRDALRLSSMMSRKSVLSGLWHGGAKAVLISQSGEMLSDEAIVRYAEIVNALQGQFVTGGDVGVSDQQVQLMRKASKYIVGTKHSPSVFTAMGLLRSMEVCLKHKFDSSTIESRSFAIQGAGKIGHELLKLIYGKAAEIYIADVDPQKILRVKSEFPQVKSVAPEEIFLQEVDVIAPCALGLVIDQDVVRKLNCAIVVGGANNQLKNAKCGNDLYDKKIIYGPDYLVNSGGLISVVSEYEKPGVTMEEITRRIDIIGDNLNRVLDVSERKSIAPESVANSLAEDKIQQLEIQHAGE